MTSPSNRHRTGGGPWLVAYDFSPAADAAAELAARDAERWGARLVLLHVVNPELLASEIDWDDREFASLPWTVRISKARQAVQARLETRRDRLRQDHPGVTADVDVATGIIPEAVLETAERCGAARIIVGTHGRRGLGRLVLGSVAEEILRDAQVPVLVTHPIRDD